MGIVCLQIEKKVVKMLRQFSRLISNSRLNFSRNLSQKSGNEYFEDSLLPKYSKEGIPMRDPRDINDPDYDKPVGNVESENFTFDYESGIGQVSFDICRFKLS